MPKTKYYAVAIGREGPKIYNTWEECRKQVEKYKRAKHRSFSSMDQAKEWLSKQVTALSPHPRKEIERENSLNTMQVDEPTPRPDPKCLPFTPSLLSVVLEVPNSSQIIFRSHGNTTTKLATGAAHLASVKTAEASSIDGTVTTPDCSVAPQTPGAKTKIGSTPTRIGNIDLSIILPPLEDDDEDNFDMFPPTFHHTTDAINGIHGGKSSIASPSLRPSELVLDGEQPPREPPVTLSPEQQEVLDIVKGGGNVFFTGSAGTGKSVLLREIIKLEGGQKCIAITAATGMASVNIGGTTLHSWAGIGLGKESVEDLVERICSDTKGRVVERRWREVDILIIDEISMIDGILFDKVEAIARGVRGIDLPFGGIQLVLSGDFCQLPPIGGRDQNGREIQPTFAFEAKSWFYCIGRPIVLRKIFRQQDQVFVDILNDMRFGRLAEETKVKLGRLCRKVKYDDDIEPTELFPTRKEVDGANQSRLDQLPGEAITFKSKDEGGWDPNGVPLPSVHVQDLLNRLIAPEVITLKVGAQVMLLKNVIQGQLVNGTVGKVTQFMTAEEALAKGIEPALVWLGGDDDGRDTDEDYVKNKYKIRGIDIEPDSPTGNTNRRKHGKFAHRIKYRRRRYPRSERPNIAVLFPIGKWPVVDFLTPSGSKRTVICVPNDFTVDNAQGRMEAAREQVPLILAWALSVHKCQGKTLNRVKVDLKKIFENGQAYVALSRATTMEHLQVANFHPSKVMAHPRVIQWYQELFPDDPQFRPVSSPLSMSSPTNSPHRKNLSPRTSPFISPQRLKKVLDVIKSIPDVGPHTTWAIVDHDTLINEQRAEKTVKCEKAAAKTHDDDIIMQPTSPRKPLKSDNTDNIDTDDTMSEAVVDRPKVPDSRAGFPDVLGSRQMPLPLPFPCSFLRSNPMTAVVPPSKPSRSLPVPAPAPEPITLSPEQQTVLDTVRSGGNVFFTGAAGTGKSVLLREIIKWKRQMIGSRFRHSFGSSDIIYDEGNNKQDHYLAITALTGIASVHIGGVTLHSWAGIGMGKESAEDLASKILWSKSFVAAKARWKEVEMLIVDEISMLDGALFDKLEEIARVVREDSTPFGGIQLVLSGDFCQLPPIGGKDEGQKLSVKFSFDAETWCTCVGRPITLKKVFRQRDQAFVDMLNDMRFGRLSKEAEIAFKGLDREVNYDDGIEPTELFPIRAEVDKANQRQLNKLLGPVYRYYATDKAGTKSNGYPLTNEEAKKLLDRLVAPDEIALKVGTQVMLIKNIIQGILVNGTIGKVTRFLTSQKALEEGITVARTDYVADEDEFTTDESEHETWFSKSKPKAGSQKFAPDSASVEAQVDAFLAENDRPKKTFRRRRWRRSRSPAARKTIVELFPDGAWPVVEFKTGSGNTAYTHTVICVPNDFTIENAEGTVEAKREQIPLILAWALTVHKSQGQTLERVKVDLKRMFEMGQAYVALSRATTLKQLQVTNFHPSKVMAHPRVIEWYQELYPEDPQFKPPSPVLRPFDFPLHKHQPQNFLSPMEKLAHRQTPKTKRIGYTPLQLGPGTPTKSSTRNSNANASIMVGVIDCDSKRQPPRKQASIEIQPGKMDEDEYAAYFDDIDESNMELLSNMGY